MILTPSGSQNTQINIILNLEEISIQTKNYFLSIEIILHKFSNFWHFYWQIAKNRLTMKKILFF